jgi:serpin B
MYVFLPAKKSSLREFRLDLNSGAWDKWMRRFEAMEGHIRLPRFKLTYQAMLNSPLSQLGMALAFDPQRARFDAISAPPPAIWIETVLHRAFLEINEEGTEAAAVSAVHMVALSMRPTKPPRTFEMLVDRPFFFAIRDDLTNTILFMGSVEEPDS